MLYVVGENVRENHGSSDIDTHDGSPLLRKTDGWDTQSFVDFLGQIREHWGHYRSHRIEDLVIRSANRERIIYSH
jgi:hypothetical protein